MAYHGSAVQYHMHDLDSYSEATRIKSNGCRYIVAATILTIAVAAVIIIALGVPLGVINEKYGSRVTSTSPISDTAMCLTPECIKLAASVLSTIDQTVDPCTDFYKFSCGNWIQNTIIPIANCEFELLSCTTLAEIRLVFIWQIDFLFKYITR